MTQLVAKRLNSNVVQSENRIDDGATALQTPRYYLNRRVHRYNAAIPPALQEQPLLLPCSPCQCNDLPLHGLRWQSIELPTTCYNSRRKVTNSTKPEQIRPLRRSWTTRRRYSRTPSIISVLTLFLKSPLASDEILVLQIHMRRCQSLYRRYSCHWHLH